MPIVILAVFATFSGFANATPLGEGWEYVKKYVEPRPEDPGDDDVGEDDAGDDDGPRADFDGTPRLRVAPDDRHVLETEDGQDFFWLGNMPWLPEQITMTEMGQYLDALRAARRYACHGWTTRRPTNGGAIGA